MFPPSAAVLMEEPDAMRVPMRRGIDARDGDGPRRRGGEPEEEPPEGRLPRPIGAGDPDHLAAGDGQGETREDRACPDPVLDPTGLDHGVHQLIMSLRSVPGTQRMPSAAYLT